jgi:hypothetical protein
MRDVSAGSSEPASTVAVADEFPSVRDGEQHESESVMDEIPSVSYVSIVLSR